MAGIIGGALSLFGASKQASAAKTAANDQVAGQKLAINEIGRQYDLSRADELPYMQSGVNNLGIANALNSGDSSKFFQSPDYTFAFNQGLQALDRGAAARGSLYSGGHSLDEIKFGQGLATQNYNNFYNKIMGLANLGQDAAARTGALGANAASGIANSYGNIGNAQAQGAIGSANAWSNGLGQIASILTQSSYPTASNPNPNAGWGLPEPFQPPY